MSSTEQSKPKYKAFTYTTGLSWIESKIGTLVSDGKPELQTKFSFLKTRHLHLVSE